MVPFGNSVGNPILMDGAAAVGYNKKMELPHGISKADDVGRNRFSVILSHPESPENIGLAARAMKNTGFRDLRLVGLDHLSADARRTAVHAESILNKARFFPDLDAAIKSLHLVFASTARFRKTFSILTFPEALAAIVRFPRTTRIGLLFGNERTGLTSEELGSANFIFSIPQASRQPSYNLASAVLLTLFAISGGSQAWSVPEPSRPVTRKIQEDCIRVVLMKLERSGFIHSTNKDHVSEMVRGLFGRMALNDKDKRFLMAVFTSAVSQKRMPNDGDCSNARRPKMRMTPDGGK